MEVPPRASKSPGYVQQTLTPPIPVYRTPILLQHTLKPALPVRQAPVVLQRALKSPTPNHWLLFHEGFSSRGRQRSSQRLSLLVGHEEAWHMMEARPGTWAPRAGQAAVASSAGPGVAARGTGKLGVRGQPPEVPRWHYSATRQYHLAVKWHAALRRHSWRRGTASWQSNRSRSSSGCMSSLSRSSAA